MPTTMNPNAMRHLCGWALTLVAGIAMAAEPAAASPHLPDGQGRILDFGPAFDLATVQRNSSEAVLGGTAEAPALRVTAKAKGSWPGVNIAAPNGHWDLSGYEYMTLEIRNVDSHDIDVFVRVDNPGANGRDHCMTERVGTQPDQRVTMTLPLKRKSTSSIKLFGMHGYPQGLYASGGIDTANVVAITVFTENQPAQDRSFEISNVRVFGTYREPVWLTMTEQEFFPFIDTFGQFRYQTWPGKVTSVEDLAANRAAETAQLAAQPAPPTWNQWGGWENGPQLEATGHFRTAKHEGKWWLVDPDGRLFFSVGVTCVDTSWGATPLDDREHWYAGLPADDTDPLKPFHYNGGKSWGGGYYAGKSPMIFNFSRANLLRKYGPDWSKVYPEVIHTRLRSWGLNTIGNWSDGRIVSMKRTPYVRTFFYDVPKLRGGKANFPDMFAPNFAAALDAGAKQFLGGSVDDPWCIGYFVDNEMPWGGEDTLAKYALGSPATQAAKQALMAWLQERHPTIADLNTAWGTTWASWEAFAGDTASKPTSETARAQLIEFTGVMAERYFSQMQAAIRRIAPNKLYLGCRCVGGSSNVIAAAVRYSDVISYNRYCASVRDIRLPDGLDAPVIIGEFHFGGLDRGPFWGGLFSADNQNDRAEKYAAYVNSALDNPQMVGVHWFQYGDQAATGRIDGENAQCGFVDICDTPYQETIDAARATAAAMYQRRMAAR